MRSNTQHSANSKVNRSQSSTATLLFKWCTMVRNKNETPSLPTYLPTSVFPTCYHLTLFKREVFKALVPLFQWTVLNFKGTVNLVGFLLSFFPPLVNFPLLH